MLQFSCQASHKPDLDCCLLLMKTKFVFYYKVEVPESGGRAERHRIHVARSWVWSFHSHRWFRVVICWCWSTEVLCNAAVYPESLAHLMLLSADTLCGDVDLISQQDLSPPHSAKCTKIWLRDHGVTVIVQEIGLSWNLERSSGVLSRGRRGTPGPTVQMSWSLLSKQPGISVQPSIPTDWSLPSHITLTDSCKRSPDQVLGEHTFQKPHISV